MFAISAWLHVAVHVALIASYFFVKGRIGRSAPRTIAALCAFALAVALLDAVAMPLNVAMPRGRVMLGLIIDVGLAFVFCGMWAEARGRVRP